MDARPTTPPPPSREQAVAAAGQFCRALDSRDDSYVFSDVVRDAGVMARFLVAEKVKEKAPPAPPAPQPGDPRPVDAKVLEECGLTPATDNRVTWAAVAADGRELVYTLEVVTDGLAATPTFRLMDEDGDGANLPVPRSAGELAEMMRVLRFVRS